MRTGHTGVALLGGAASFGACGLSLVLVGLGLPFLVAAAVAGLCAGLLVYALARWSLARLTLPAAGARPGSLAQPDELPNLRHELRGALSPALMVTDRLLRNDDPAVRRAGETVVRSIERTIELLARPELDDPSLARPYSARTTAAPRPHSAGTGTT